MSAMKLTFDIEEADRLRRKIGQVSQDTNWLYMQFKGQAGNWNGIPLGSSLQQAQVLLNELTVEAERMEDHIRAAVKGVQNVQEENKQRTNQLMQQFSVLGVLFGRLDGSAAAGRIGIPALAQAAVMKLITNVSILSGRDELSRDPAVQKLQGAMKAAAFGSLGWFAAQIKLTEIYEARNQIAKAQTAYGVYQAFGNRIQMEAVHQSAEAARQKLESLGVNKLQYEPGKDLSGYFKQAAVLACDYDPSITAGSMPLLQDEAYQLLLRMAMEPGVQGEWAKSQLPAKRLEVQLAQTAKILAATIEAEQRLAGPPVNLPDGTPITAKNKENEITLAYFQDKVYNPDAQLTPMYTAYLGWLEDTYGMTEWRKKVVQADAVVMSFTEALLKETVLGVVDTAKFAFRLAVDPEKTTQEVLDQANYLINHPEVLVEAAKTVYHNFEEGTPEERAAMLGSVASVLVPGLSVTKSGKVGQVLDGVQGLADKAVEGVKDLGKVLKNSEKFPDRNPFVMTPEGFSFNFNTGKIPETNPLPKTAVQEHYLSEMDGLGDGKAGKIEGTGEPKAQLGKEDLDDLRKRWNVPETDTIAIGKTDVKGLEDLTFEGGSPMVRKEAGLPDLDEIMPDRPIQAPRKSPQFTRHAEEGVINDFVGAVEKAGLKPEEVTGTLYIHQSNTKGVCTACIQGISNPNVKPGIFMQLSQKYPNLIIKVTSEVEEGIKLAGKLEFTLKGGKLID